MPCLHDFAVSGHIFEKDSAHVGVGDLGGLSLEQITSSFQYMSGARIAAGLQDTVASQVDPQRLPRAIRCVVFQVTQDFLNMSPSERRIALSQRNTGQAGQRLDGQVILAQFVPQSHSLLVSYSRFG